jgi:hypothetical protein
VLGPPRQKIGAAGLQKIVGHILQLRIGQNDAWKFKHAMPRLVALPALNHAARSPNVSRALFGHHVVRRVTLSALAS